MAYKPLTGKIRSTSLPLLIGQMLPENAEYNFKGIIDEVKLFENAVSPAKASAMYQSGITAYKRHIGDHLSDFKIYPNPAKDRLSLQLPVGFVLPAHKHAGDAMAILGGDALLACAFDCVLRLPLHQAYKSRMADTSRTAQIVAPLVTGAVRAQREDDADSLLRVELLRELATASTAMSDGQVWDTLGGLPPNLTPHEELRLIHSHKTGSLLAAACRMGVLCALGPFRSEQQVASLAAIDTYGTEIGLMFQIVDDLIDATQPSEHAGKKTGKDAEDRRFGHGAIHLSLTYRSS